MYLDPKKIGSFIYELRKTKNLSQEELSQMIPISREAVSKWERGITIPNSETLVILSDIFNVSVDSLLLGEYTTKNNEEQLQSLALEILDDNNSKNKMIHKLKILIIFLFIFIFIFFCYYFFKTYNSIRVYMVSGSGKSFSMEDGIFVTTKEKMYFRFGDFIFSSEGDIKGIEMYYQKDGKEKIIFSSDSSIRMIKDYYGYDAYFELKELNSILNDSYLRIQYSNSQETIKLKFTKDFANNKFLFSKRPKVSKEKNESTTKTSNNVIETIQNRFECANDVCTFQAEEGNISIEFSYFDIGKYLTILEKDEDKITEWIYSIEGNILYYKSYLKERLIDEHELYLNRLKVTNQNYKYFQEFQDKYILKYLS